MVTLAYVGEGETCLQSATSPHKILRGDLTQNNGNNLIISYGFGPHTWYRTESESSLPYGGFMSPFDEFEWPWNKVGWKIYSIYTPVPKLNPSSHTTSYIQVCRNLNSLALSFYKLGPRCSRDRDWKKKTRLDFLVEEQSPVDVSFSRLLGKEV